MINGISVIIKNNICLLFLRKDGREHDLSIATIAILDSKGSDVIIQILLALIAFSY